MMSREWMSSVTPVPERELAVECILQIQWHLLSRLWECLFLTGIVKLQGVSILYLSRVFNGLFSL